MTNDMKLNQIIARMDLSERMLGGRINYLSQYISSQKSVLKNINSGKPYILCTYYVPSELTAVFDTEFIYIERIVGLCVSGNILQDKILDKYGYCSYQRAFLYLLENNHVPLPELIIAFDYPCGDGIWLCRHVSEKYNIPLLIMTKRNLRKDLEKIYEYLRNHYSVKQSIKRTVELASEALNVKRQIDELRIMYPGIISSADIMKIFTVENDFGKISAVSVLRSLLEYCKEQKYANNIKKIFWMGLVPLFDNNILTKLENKYPCKFVYEEMWDYSYVPKNTGSLIDFISEKIENSLFISYQKRMDKLILTMKKLKIDTVINLTHNCCSFLPPSVKYVQMRLDNENIDLYNLTIDVIQKNKSYNKFETKLEKVILNILNE